MKTVVKTEVKTGGIGFLGVLTIVFIVLKLVGVIDWSWFWVLFPFTGPIILLLAFASMAGIIGVILNGIEIAEKKGGRK